MLPKSSPRGPRRPPKSIQFWLRFLNAFRFVFCLLLGSLKTQKSKKSMEGLLKIKGATFAPGTHFLPGMLYFGVHFGTQNGTRINEKRIKKPTAKINRKSIQRDPKTTPKWLPKSTPGAPKWCPSVRPRSTEPTFGTPGAQKWSPCHPRCPTGCPNGPPSPPQASEQILLKPQSRSRWSLWRSWSLRFAALPALFSVLLAPRPLGSPTHPPSTQQPLENTSP